MEKVTMYEMEVNVGSVLNYLKERSSADPVGMAGYNDVTVSKLALVHATAIIEHLERKCSDLMDEIQMKEIAETEKKKVPPVELNKITPRCYGEESLFCKEDLICKKCLFSCDCKNIVDQKLEDKAKEELFGGRKQKPKQPNCYGDYLFGNSDARECCICPYYKDCMAETNKVNNEKDLSWDD